MYYKGNNRVFYQTNNHSGDVIECDFLNPNLERSERIPMIYLDENLYYVDVCFKHAGSYVLRTFKDGIKLNHNIIQVGTAGGGLTIYPDSVPMV